MLARGRECLVVPYRDGRGEFWVTVLDGRGRWLDLREMQLREFHREVLRRADRQRHASGVWILERVYHNYSHWLTAHLPKLLLLRELEIPGPIFMPRQRPEFIEECLRLFGFTPGQFCDFDEARVLEVGELSVLSTDRFRPELLQLIRKWCPRLTEAVPTRRIFISRRHSERRRLLNEDELWPMLQRAGFERVAMEQYSFTEQVKLMQESAVICAPHGAGLTNMLFAPAGAHVIEMADLSFPNPNFYASACAMGHHYWLVAATGVGDVHPLEKDLEVSPGVLEDVLSRMDNASATRNADAGG